MSRPSFTYSGSGNQFSFLLPAGWFSMITSLSRKNYDQGMVVAFDFLGDRNEIAFYSPAGEDNGQMKVTLNDQTSLPIVPQPEEMNIDISCFASPTTKQKNGEQLVQASNTKANRLHIVKAESKSDAGATSNVDTMTLFVFVEDTGTASTTSGSYDDAVGLVHLLKKGN